MKTVYIETTIPSFYHETREEPMFAAMRQWTRDWWADDKINYQSFTSDAVINEIESGNHPEKPQKLALMENIELLAINWEIEEIVEVYISNYLMPKDELGDALHLAIASYHKMDFLLTWNCKHLANANKRDHIRRINERLKIFTPELVTPYELIGE
ncbi:MAG: type II toxin-antitoxin system VapC family toxin [Verrucomicrobia bacterium]|nr:type II toxin-antitoxin system VapC family toxin [Verrucomicrobiota bacterium]MCH8512055.1 type II toxin-antitoxin system VapC family toxin [Kiritimatiellia bacterium]